MRTRMTDATVVYTCSTAFPETLLDRLAQKVARIGSLRAFVSLQELEPFSRLERVAVLRLDTSWKRRANVHVYQPRR
jgi:hypothetical protein